MRLGLWGARMDDSGLGMQTWEFFRHMHPAKTMVIDISKLERIPDRVMVQHPERYVGVNMAMTGEYRKFRSDITFIDGIPNENDIREFLSGLDCVFMCESSYNMSFYRIAREMGVKTAVQYNYEFFDWKPGSFWQHDVPDMFIAPSTWHYEEIGKLCEQKGIKHVYLHVPVDRDKIPRRYIDSAHKFVHVAGRPAAHDRNGTYTFLEALKLSDGDLRGKVYTQDRNLFNEIKNKYPETEVKFNISDYTEIYKKGSVFVLPRKYGGNCLPMNEALAAGMPVIMSKIPPQLDILPERWLVSAHLTETEFAPRFKIDVYECKPVELLFKMRWFKSMSTEEMRTHSQAANEIADSISWDTMAPKYTEVLEALCHL